MHIVNIPLSALLVAYVSLSALANPTSRSAIKPRTSDAPLPVEVIYEFPLKTWVENLQVRSNGQILATIASAPELYQVDPARKRDTVLVHSFPNATGLIGITELGPDVFYVVTGSFNLQTFTSPPGSFSVWKVDMRPFSIHRRTPAKVSKVADFPDAIFLNGLTPLDHRKHLLLIADSLAGVVYRLNARTGEIKIAINDPLMKGSITPFIPGVNGVNIRDCVLYFTNSNLGIIARQHIHADGTPKGKAQAVVKTPFSDDFALGPKGEYFIAQSPTLSFAPPTADDVISTSRRASLPDISGATAVRFGRRRVDRKSVYVSSSGGIEQYITGNFTIGGAVSKVYVGSLLG